MKQMSKCTFMLGFLHWCSSFTTDRGKQLIIIPLEQGEAVKQLFWIVVEAQCLPKLFVGWSNLHTIVCSSLCLKNSLSKIIVMCMSGQVWKPTSFPVSSSLAAFRNILWLCWWKQSILFFKLKHQLNKQCCLWSVRGR